MKMVKSLLLGSAAGLVAVAGAQAADLPVKAAPVEYVKVCSLYGAGFYYIPGTDTCLKIGGYVRSDTYFGNHSPAGFTYLGTRDRNWDEFVVRSRAALSFDARSQTEYGTLRAYGRIGGQTTNGSDGVFYDRGFIQLAGFTIGKTVSYFDIYGFAPFVANHAPWVYGDTGAVGIWVFAYTAQFGNGFSATLSAEDPKFRRKGVASVVSTTGIASTSTKGAQYPDIVANLRVDQAWGWAQVSGALHDASGTYYTPATVAHPGDAIGYAVAAGFYLKIPGLPGDTLGAQFSYGVGALGYVTNAATFTSVMGGTTTYGYIVDGVYNSATGGIEKTTAWSINAGYQHRWSPTLASSIYGGYVKVDYNSTASTLLCAGVAGCNPDHDFYQIGSRPIYWTPVKNLSIGVDIMYTRLNGGTGTVNGVTTTGSHDIWDGMLRVQRDFWP